MQMETLDSSPSHSFPSFDFQHSHYVELLKAMIRLPLLCLIPLRVPSIWDIFKALHILAHTVFPL